jgi:MraZ protein
MALTQVGKELRKFDQVNRMSVPPTFRKDLGDTIYILKSIYKEPCLVLFSEEDWINFSNGFISAYSGIKQAKAQRKLADRVDKATVDKSGRITIKDDFKAYAELEDEVLVVGTMDRVELWTAENWELAKNADDDDDFDFEQVSYSNPRR